MNEIFCPYAQEGLCCLEKHKKRVEKYRNAEMTIELKDGRTFTVKPYAVHDFTLEEPYLWNTAVDEDWKQTIYSWWNDKVTVANNWARLKPKSRREIQQTHHQQVTTQKDILCPYRGSISPKL